jgi:drug/metabolite transporter (DMT)-like permease
VADQNEIQLDVFGVSAALVSTACRGANKVALRVSLLTLHEATATTMASAIAVAMFGVPLAFLGWGPTFPSIAAIVTFALAGNFNNSFGRIFVWKSVANIGANRGNVLSATQVIYTVLVAFLFLGDPVSVYLIAGIALVLFGVVVVSYRRGEEKMFTAKQRRVGLVYGLTGAVIWGLGADLQQVGESLYPNPLGASFLTFAFSFATLLPVMYFLNRNSNNAVTRLDRRGLAFIVIAGLLGNMGFFLSYEALNYIPVPVLSTINGFNPMITLMTSFALTRNLEQINRKTVLGVLASTVGVILASV